MITIPKKVEYSIVFISYLAKNKQSLSLARAAKTLSLPYRFLGQIAADLKNGGLVDSREGKLGGYKLAAGWEEKTLFDLMETLGEKKELVKCEGCGREGKCKIRNLWNKVEASFVKELKNIKLSNI